MPADIVTGTPVATNEKLHELHTIFCILRAWNRYTAVLRKFQYLWMDN